MKFGFLVTAGDPRTAADLAAEAEAAGWDGVFYWDAIAITDMEIYDPWVVMAAMAMRTERVRLGAIVSPPSRRRPWKMAKETMSLDVLSNGRLIVPVGLGALDDQAFGNVGEATEARTRAEMLDESLAILEGLWSGEPFAHEGRLGTHRGASVTEPARPARSRRRGDLRLRRARGSALSIRPDDLPTDPAPAAPHPDLGHRRLAQ